MYIRIFFFFFCRVWRGTSKDIPPLTGGKYRNPSGARRCLAATKASDSPAAKDVCGGVVVHELGGEGSASQHWSMVTKCTRKPRARADRACLFSRETVAFEHRSDHGAIDTPGLQGACVLYPRASMC